MLVSFANDNLIKLVKQPSTNVTSGFGTQRKSVQSQFCLDFRLIVIERLAYNLYQGWFVDKSKFNNTYFDFLKLRF